MNQLTLSDQIIGFYSGAVPDTNGRRIQEIWAWDDARLESVHDYIQWLFPLREGSRFNPAAPVLTEHTVEVFRRDDALRARMKKSFEVMLEFYGLCLVEDSSGSIQVRYAPGFADKARNWLTRGNHNHLRLTRIMRSTSALGLGAYSNALFMRLTQIHAEYPGSISQETYAYWKQAAD